MESYAPSTTAYRKNGADYTSDIELRYEDAYGKIWTLTGFGSGEQAYYIAIDAISRGLFFRAEIWASADAILYPNSVLAEAAHNQ